MSDDSPDTHFALLDKSGMLRDVSPPLAHLLGYHEEELAGQPIKLILGRLTPDPVDLTSLRRAVEKTNGVALLSQTGQPVSARIEVDPEGTDGFYMRVNPAGVSKPAPPPSVAPRETPPVSRPAPVSTPPVSAPPVPAALAPSASVSPAAPKPVTPDSNEALTFLPHMTRALSHPLTDLAETTAMIRTSTLSPQQREWVDRLHRSVQRLTEIAETFNDAAQIGSGEAPPVENDFSLNAMIDSAIQFAAAMARAKGLTLTVQRPPGDRTLRGDRDRLARAVAWMVDAAVDATEKGTVGVAVTCGEDTDPDLRLKFAVTDAGPALSADERARILDGSVPSGPTTAGGGSPLGGGRALIRRLVTVRGGRVGAEAAPSGGNVIWMEWPVKKSQGSNSVGNAAKNGDAAEPAAVRRPFKILLAEDNTVDQKFIGLLLEKLGYGADLVENGPAAVEAFFKRPYDLVLMECQLPGTDGLKTARAIREREGQRRHTPIAALTANASDEEREQCLAAGMDEYLSKPLVIERLSALLATWDVSVDLDTLKGLRDLGADSFPRLRDDFLRQSREQWDEFRQSVGKRDWAVAGTLARRIKGTGGTFGAVRLQRLARRAEESCADPKAPELEQLCDAMGEEIVRLAETLKYA